METYPVTQCLTPASSHVNTVCCREKDSFSQLSPSQLGAEFAASQHCKEISYYTLLDFLSQIRHVCACMCVSHAHTLGHMCGR